jgi:hypothetical protein
LEKTWQLVVYDTTLPARGGPEFLAMVLTGVFGGEEDFVAAPGKWSIRQIVAHLADSELVCAHRMRQIVAEDSPTLIAFDQDAWTKNLDYARRKPKQSLESFRSDCSPRPPWWNCASWRFLSEMAGNFNAIRKILGMIYDHRKTRPDDSPTFNAY